MQTLKEFYYFVEEITKERGKKYKAGVLEKYKDDDTIKRYLYFLYNPYIVTGISKKKLNTKIADEVIQSLLTRPKKMSELLVYICRHSTGRRVDIAVVQAFRANYVLTDETADIDHDKLVGLFNRLITKDLPLGIDVKTINSVIPGLIPNFDVMLANKYFDKPQIVEGKTFALTTKIDGGRIIAIKKNGAVKLYTRQGQRYEGLVDLETELEDKFPDNICLDGEITLLNPYMTDDAGNTIKLLSKDQYKETMKITRADGEKHGVKMLVFDYLPADEFETQKCTMNYWTRRTLLQQMFNDICKPTYFSLLPILYVGADTKKITSVLKSQVAAGEEGIMINICNAKYEYKRTNQLLKVKIMQDIDLPVVGFEEGTNRNAGTLGALLVDYNGNIVKVGSGFTDELRAEIWTNKDDWLGRTVTVQYFEETINQDGGTSLRFPVYIDYRTDK